MLRGLDNNLRKWLKVSELSAGMQIAVPRAQAVICHGGMAADDALLEAGEGDILWDEIVEIKKVGEERVYDIEVEGTHNFVAGHLIDLKTKQPLKQEQEAEYLDKISKLQDTISKKNPNPKFQTPNFEIKNSNIKNCLEIGNWKLEIADKIGFGGIFAHNTYIAGSATTTDHFTADDTLYIKDGAVSIGTATTSDDLFRIATSTGGDRFVVEKDNGKVGIGTASPNYRLDVYDSSNTAVRLADDGGKALVLETNDTSSGGVTLWNATLSGNHMYFRSGISSDNDFIFQTSGNTRIKNITATSSLVDNFKAGSATTTDTMTIGANALGQLSVTQGATDRTAFGVRAAGSATANLISLQNSSGTFLSGFTAAGGLLMNLASSTALSVQNGSGNQVLLVNTSAPEVRIYDGSGNYLSLDHDGTDAIITASTGNINIGTAGNDIFIGAVGTASNLVFEETASILGQGGNGIIFGQAGDYFDLSVAGVDYWFETISASSTNLILDASSTVDTLVVIKNSRNQDGGPGARLVVEGAITVASSTAVGYFYNNFGGGTPGQSAIATSGDVYIRGDFEVDGTAYLSGGTAWTQGDFAENITVRSLTVAEISKIQFPRLPSASPQANGGQAISKEISNSNFQNFTSTTTAADEYGGEIDETWLSLPEPGDVVVMDPEAPWQAVKNYKANSNQILGIVSTDPAGILRGELGRSGTVRPLALSGTVPVKVSLENGPIKKGDLLTTASTPGYAMKATYTDAGVIGIALEDYAGEITNNQETIAQQTPTTNSQISNITSAADLIASSAGAMQKERDIREIMENQVDDAGQEESLENIEQLENSQVEKETKETVALTTGKQILALVAINNKTTYERPAKLTDGLNSNGTIETIYSKENINVNLSIIDAGELEQNKSEIVLLSITAYQGDLRVEGLATLAGGLVVYDKANIYGDLFVDGMVRVAGDMDIRGDLNISGALTAEFEYASNTMLLIGDAVGINSDGLAQKTRADILLEGKEQIPAIGIVAEIIEGANKVKVAIGGTVGGFKDLAIGKRYYLANSSFELAAILENGNSSSTDGMAITSLMPEKSIYEGEMIQVMGIAKSATEILIMPSLEFTIVENGDTAPSESVIYKNYVINVNAESPEIQSPSTQETEYAEQSYAEQEQTMAEESEIESESQETTDGETEESHGAGIESTENVVTEEQPVSEPVVELIAPEAIDEEDQSEPVVEE